MAKKGAIWVSVVLRAGFIRVALIRPEHQKLQTETSVNAARLQALCLKSAERTGLFRTAQCFHSQLKAGRPAPGNTHLLTSVYSVRRSQQDYSRNADTEALAHLSAII
jgi:hypothetical protein